MTVYEKRQHDVTAYRDFDPNEDPNDADANWIWDCIFQEIAIDTKVLIFEWRASDHIPMNDTYHNIWHAGNHDDPFDWFHINSISKDELGNYLISARFTQSITYIDGISGAVIWTLGGRNNDFMDLSNGLALNFAWQHDARFVAIDDFPKFYRPSSVQPGFTTALVSLFDNAAEDQNYEYGMEMSRGLLLEVTFPIAGDESEGKADLRRLARERDRLQEKNTVDVELSLDELKVATINGTDPDYTVRVVKSYENPGGVRSSSQGSMQMLSQSESQDSKVLVGYGLNAVWTEFASNGTVLCDAHYGAVSSWERGDIQSYRTYKFAWTGSPTQSPKIDISDDEDEVYASWNGATEISEWVLQGSTSDDVGDIASWEEIVRLPKDGFEAVFDLANEDLGPLRYLRALAIGPGGSVLPNGESRILDRGYLASLFPAMSQHLPDQVAGAALSRIFLCAIIVVAAAFLLFEMCRRYLCWKAGRPASGAFRWRKGTRYNSLSDG
jgi:hypothetical protein